MQLKKSTFNVDMKRFVKDCQLNYIQYYDRYEILVYKYKCIEIGFCFRFLMGLLAIILGFISLGVLFLFISQFFSIISEASYYEKEKDPLKEAHYLIIPSTNDKCNVFLN